MYIKFRDGKTESWIKDINLIRENQNNFYLFEKNLIFGARYEDFMVIINNLGALIKEMDLNEELKERILRIVYLLNDIVCFQANNDLYGEEIIEDMLRKLKDCKYGVKEYPLNLTVKKVEGHRLTTEEHQSYINYNKLSCDEKDNNPELIDMSTINYIIEEDILKAYTNINRNSSFWAISMLDAGTTNYKWELYKNLKEMLFEMDNLSRGTNIIYNKENNIIFTEMTQFNLHKETVHAANQLLNALRYALNSYTFRTNKLLHYDLNKIDTHIEFFDEMMKNSYEVAKYQYKQRNL